MRLHQLKLDFNPEQDRLLLRVSTDNQLEVRLWLTRRALRLLPCRCRRHRRRCPLERRAETVPVRPGRAVRMTLA